MAHPDGNFLGWGDGQKRRRAGREVGRRLAEPTNRGDGFIDEEEILDKIREHLREAYANTAIKRMTFECEFNRGALGCGLFRCDPVGPGPTLIPDFRTEPATRSGQHHGFFAENHHMTDLEIIKRMDTVEDEE